MIDGDTIEVEIAGSTARVRYIGVDTPESGRPYFREATDANRRLVEGRAVLLERDISETDRFGRLLRYVYVESFTGLTMVNAELVRLGYAQLATFPPDVRHVALFVELERQARASAIGLWAAPSPTPPVRSATPTLATPAPTVAAPATPTPLATLPPATAAPTAPPTVRQTIAPTPTAAPPTLRPTVAPARTTPPTGLVITALFYDGYVFRTEADEYVEITNYGPSAQNIAGWRIVSVRGGQSYNFPAITIAAGQTCRVYTNELHPEWCGLSWGRGSAVWNNDGDRAQLVSPSGTVVSTRGYLGW